MSKIKKDQNYALQQLGEESKISQKRAVSPPIYNSSTFAYDTFAEMQEVLLDEKNNSLYTRGNNPTVRLLEQKLAKVQGTEDALCFGSGSAAIAAAVVNCVEKGDHVLCVKSAYSWTQKLLDPLLAKFGVAHTYADGTDTEGFLSEIRDSTKLIIVESPTSLLFELQDIVSIAAEARKRGITTLMDNSYASPLSQYPVECGIDIIAHSATKYIAGHSDVVAGVLCGTAERLRSIFYEGYMTFGAALAPESAWLIMRSLRTLDMRIERASNSVIPIAEFLRKHEAIAKVNWPFFEDNPQRELVERQFVRPMPMLSIELKEASKVPAFCDRLKIFQLAVSWGSFESLIVPVQAFPKTDLPIGLVRIYVGFENTDDLIEDLEFALRSN